MEKQKIDYLHILSYALLYRDKISYFEIFLINNYLNSTGKYIVPDNNFDEINDCIIEWNDFFGLTEDKKVYIYSNSKKSAFELFSQFFPDELQNDMSKALKKIKR